MRTFQDSIPHTGQDPYVATTSRGSYFIESQDEARIAISTLKSLHSTPSPSDFSVVWDGPTHQQFQVWAPELHYFAPLWYIYYAASNGDNQTHRCYVLEADNPLGPYTHCGQISPTDQWAIDLTTFPYNGQRYAVWSGWGSTPEFPQHLYIARMQSQFSLDPSTLLSSPTEPWEQSHASILEGPQWANHPELGRGLTYSANASWTQDYATGFLEFFGTDPLNPEHWAKDATPLATNCGHGQVVTDTFMYHRKMSALPGWQDREIRTMPLSELLGTTR